MFLPFLAAFVVLLVIAFVVTLGALIGIGLAVTRLRRRMRIAVRPALEPTAEEDLPLPLKEFIGRAAPILVFLGFKPVASVHAPGFATATRGTHVLFVEPGEGHRASLLCNQEGNVCLPVARMQRVEHLSDASAMRSS